MIISKVIFDLRDGVIEVEESYFLIKKINISLRVLKGCFILWEKYPKNLAYFKIYIIQVSFSHKSSCKVVGTGSLSISIYDYCNHYSFNITVFPVCYFLNYRPSIKWQLFSFPYRVYHIWLLFQRYWFSGMLSALELWCPLNDIIRG